MPLYDYRCTKCGQAFEELATIEGRNDMLSPCCCCVAELQMSPVPDISFKPFVHEDFGDKPVLVKSKNHYKELCQQHGVYAKHVFGDSWNLKEV